jgi:hypothetical protein
MLFFRLKKEFVSTTQTMFCNETAEKTSGIKEQKVSVGGDV